jgi:hypothetical protein
MSAVRWLQRLYEKHLATADGQHRIATTDDANFEYALNCILDHAERLVAGGSRPKSKAAPKAAKSTARPRKAAATS